MLNSFCCLHLFGTILSCNEESLNFVCPLTSDIVHLVRSFVRWLVGWLVGCTYEEVSKSFRTGRLERELQMVQLSATRCSCIAISCVSLVSFASITLYVASQRVIPKASVYLVIDSVRKLLDTPSYTFSSLHLFLDQHPN
jgi:hypothetical protein